MNTLLKGVVTLSTLSALTFIPMVLSADLASAQPAGMDDFYIGAGGSAGLTSGGAPRGFGEKANFGGNIQGRFVVPSTPVSVRGAILFSDTASQIMPLLTYDVPISDNANAYIGGGYSFFETNKTNRHQPTPLGNQDTPVVTAGVEAGVTRDVVVYSDMKWGIDAYQSGNDIGALSWQFGAGFRF